MKLSIVNHSDSTILGRHESFCVVIYEETRIPLRGLKCPRFLAMMMILLIKDINDGKNENNDENDNGCFGHFSLKLLTF